MTESVKKRTLLHKWQEDKSFLETCKKSFPIHGVILQNVVFEMGTYFWNVSLVIDTNSEF